MEIWKVARYRNVTGCFCFRLRQMFLSHNRPASMLWRLKKRWKQKFAVGVIFKKTDSAFRLKPKANPWASLAYGL
jgi:hypothetical protein